MYFRKSLILYLIFSPISQSFVNQNISWGSVKSGGPLNIQRFKNFEQKWTKSEKKTQFWPKFG